MSRLPWNLPSNAMELLCTAPNSALRCANRQAPRLPLRDQRLRFTAEVGWTKWVNRTQWVGLTILGRAHRILKPLFQFADPLEQLRQALNRDINALHLP